MAVVEVDEHRYPFPKETVDQVEHAICEHTEVEVEVRKTLGPGKNQCGVQMVEGEESGAFR